MTSKYNVYVAGQSFVVNAEPEDIDALCRILRTAKYISWQVSVISEPEYQKRILEADERAANNLKIFQNKIEGK